MTQGDGGGTKAQSYCPDQYRHIEGRGHIATCLLWCSVMKKKNSYRRKGGGVRPEHKQHVMFARRSVKNKRGGSQSGLFPSVWQTWDPGRRNHSSDVSRVGVSADSNNKTHIVAHTSLLTLSLSFSVELQDRDWKRRYTYTPRGERQRWLNRHTVLGFTGSSDAFPVLRGKKKKGPRRKRERAQGGE